MRTLAIVMALFFSMCAGLQYNDPDPLLWFLIYIVAIVFSVLAIRVKFFPTMSGVGILIYIGLAIWIGASHSGASINTEEIREIGGVLLCAAWLGFLTVYGQNKLKKV